jgi:hypothetical protein
VHLVQVDVLDPEPPQRAFVATTTSLRMPAGCFASQRPMISSETPSL